MDPTVTDSPSKVNEHRKRYSVEEGRVIYFGAVDKHLSFLTVQAATYRKAGWWPSWLGRPVAPEVLVTFPFTAFPSNRVTSAQYTLWSFLPIQLVHQFRKLANAYFLFISILQLVPDLSPTGQYSTLGPLVVFLFLALLREAYDDYRRHQQDQAENSAETYVVRMEYATEGSASMNAGGGSSDPIVLTSSIPRSPADRRLFPLTTLAKTVDNHFSERVQWKQVTVGDIICLKDDEQVPADLLLLASTLDDGLALVETSSLDGETSLRQKQSLAVTSSMKEDEICSLRAAVHAETANNNLYLFDGYLEMVDAQSALQRYPLTIQQLLLRGSVLRNTGSIYGVAVFTGEETKIRKNATTVASAKSPVMELNINIMVIALFIYIILLAFISTGVGVNWMQMHAVSHWYLVSKPLGVDQQTLLFFTFIVLYNTIIPISLYVTMEIVKLIQAWLISFDKHMVHPETGIGAVAHTSNLNEDLGQVSYLFSDKTGTLTENEMKFRKFSSASRQFEYVDNMLVGTTIRGTKEIGTRLQLNNELVELEEPKHNEKVIQGTKILDFLYHPRPNGDALVKEMVLAMAVCHTVTPSFGRPNDSLFGVGSAQLPAEKRFADLIYLSSSPDELAILNAANGLGHVFYRRNLQGILVHVGDPRESSSGMDIALTPLCVIEFSSERRRMTVIYRLSSNAIRLYCKGADSVLMPRLASPNTEDEQSNLSSVQRDIQEYSVSGLRTLVYAYRDIESDEFEIWYRKFETACTSIQNRKECIELCAEEIEVDLKLLGATAVEDRLQDGVAQTLDDLRKANIRLWVLTGDKRETAINLGYSCRLIRSFSTLITLEWTRQKGETGLAELMKTHIDRLKVVRSAADPLCDLSPKSHFVMVVDGNSLMKMEEQHSLVFMTRGMSDADHYPLSKLSWDTSLITMLVELGILCDSVLCCRVNPKQKALMVRYVKQRLGRRCVVLAIGDGSNDIAMIREANVGVGLSGREGMQAARASDYSISRFKHLKRLLLVHGHWSYVRVSHFLFGSFYKCLTFYMTQILYQYATGMSGTSLYESWTLALYNLAFSSLPVIFVGIFEKDLNEGSLMMKPSLYGHGQRNEAYRPVVVALWILSSLYHSACLTFIPLSSYGGFPGTDDLSTGDNASNRALLGVLVYTSVVFVVNIKIAWIESHTIVWPAALVTAATIAAWFVYQVVYSTLWPYGDLGYSNTGVAKHLFTSSAFYLIVAFTVTVCLLPDIVFRVVKRSFFPSSLDLCQEQEKLEEHEHGSHSSLKTAHSVPQDHVFQSA